jgi:hypothetical protein
MPAALLPSPLRRLVGIGGGAAIFCLIAGQAAAAWSWAQHREGSDLWLTASQNGTKVYDLRLGAAGSIAELHYVPDGDQDLLANPYGDNDTDRVIQWTLWSDSLSAMSDGVSVPFNEDLAGSSDDVFSPTVAVSSGRSAVDIYAVPQDQWDQSLDGAMQARYSCLTRYELQPNGVLKIRRVVLTGSVANQSDGGGYDVYFEEWNPFKVGENSFDAFALSLDSTGTPDWWYSADYNIPYYQYLPVGDSFGYAIAYHQSAPQTMPVIGVVFGTQELRIVSAAGAAGPVGRHVFNSMGWGSETPDDQGIALLPALEMFDVPSQSVIDYTYSLVLRPGADASLKPQLESLAAATPAPVLYGPNEALPGELNAIVGQLRRNLTAPGVRTDHLAGLPSLRSYRSRTTRVGQ